MQESERNTLLGKAERCRMLLGEVGNLLEEMNRMRADLQIRLDEILAEINPGESAADAVVPVSKPRTSVNRGLKQFLYKTLETRGPTHLHDLVQLAERAGFVFKVRDKKSRLSMTMVRDKQKFTSDGQGIWFVKREGDAVDTKNDSGEDSDVGAAVLRLREYL